MKATKKAIGFFERIEAMPPEEKLKSLFPQLDGLDNEKKRAALEALAAIFYGGGMDLGFPLPDWAKAASVKFWESFAGGSIAEKMENENEGAGFFLEIINMLLASERKPEWGDAAQSLADLEKNKLVDLPAEQFSEVAKARLKAKDQMEKNPSERIIVYLTIAVSWRQIEALGGQIKVHQWLLENKIISPRTSFAESSKWFRKIGLPTGKRGRPINSVTVKIS